MRHPSYYNLNFYKIKRGRIVEFDGAAEMERLEGEVCAILNAINPDLFIKCNNLWTCVQKTPKLWDNCVDNMRVLSKLMSNCLFALAAGGGDPLNLYKDYYYQGETFRCKPEITFNPWLVPKATPFSWLVLTPNS